MLKVSMLGALCFAGALACGSGSGTFGDRLDSDGGSNSGGAGQGGRAAGGGGGDTLELKADDCRGDEDCANIIGTNCAPRDLPYSTCGACETIETPCLNDDACKGQGAHFICEPVSCACDDSQTRCKAGCQTPSDCRAEETCVANRCQPKTCSSDEHCPANFSCPPLGSNTDNVACQRISCTSDGACEGYCVLGKCHDQPGICSELVAGAP